MQTFALESAGFIQRIEFGMQQTWNVGCSHLKACIDFAVQHTFKGKCAKNWYWDLSGCGL